MQKAGAGVLVVVVGVVQVASRQAKVVSPPHLPIPNLLYHLPARSEGAACRERV